MDKLRPERALCPVHPQQQIGETIIIDLCEGEIAQP